MPKTNKDKKTETITSIINSLLKICKGHERYPSDTVKLAGFPKKYPITYAQVKDVANRLKAAQRREKKQTEQKVHKLWQALVKAHTMLKVCDWPEEVDMKGVADLMKEIESAIDASARNLDEEGGAK